MVFWNGREGFDFVLAKNGRDAFKRLVEGFNKVGEYAKEKYGDEDQIRPRAEAQRAAREHVSRERRRGALPHLAPRPVPCSRSSA